MYWPFPRAQRGLLSSLTHLPPTNIMISQKMGGWRSFSQKVRRIAAGGGGGRAGLLPCRKFTGFFRPSARIKKKTPLEKKKMPPDPLVPWGGGPVSSPPPPG